ncbi:MAG: hypothetical protein GF411_02860 [Candidatus Lokiarchaeota archaeon]|nr:hypothetical protein [Candidatus Lokiarchaeota archaeon]
MAKGRIDEDVEVILDGNKYLLQEGDIVEIYAPSVSGSILQKLLAWDIKGNAADDGPALTMAHNIIMGDYPVKDKILAIKKLDEIMGVESEDPITEKDVIEYMSEHDAQT